MVFSAYALGHTRPMLRRVSVLKPLWRLGTRPVRSGTAITALSHCVTGLQRRSTVRRGHVGVSKNASDRQASGRTARSRDASRPFTVSYRSVRSLANVPPSVSVISRKSLRQPDLGFGDRASRLRPHNRGLGRLVPSGSLTPIADAILLLDGEVLCDDYPGDTAPNPRHSTAIRRAPNSGVALTQTQLLRRYRPRPHALAHADPVGSDRRHAYRVTRLCSPSSQASGTIPPCTLVIPMRWRIFTVCRSSVSSWRTNPQVRRSLRADDRERCQVRTERCLASDRQVSTLAGLETSG